MPSTAKIRKVSLTIFYKVHSCCYVTLACLSFPFDPPIIGQDCVGLVQIFYLLLRASCAQYALWRLDRTKVFMYALYSFTEGLNLYIGKADLGFDKEIVV